MLSRPTSLSKRFAPGFTFLEVFIVLAILLILGGLGMSAWRKVVTQGKTSASLANLRQLALANLAYAADHGTFVPAQERHNLIRWHGARKTPQDEFDPTQGFLSPYLGQTHQVKKCPLLSDVLTGADSWEWSTGGYGYNAAYIGGTPFNWEQPERPANLPQPALTIMFTTTALPKAKGLQEYPYTEPYFHLRRGKPFRRAEASVHFRANGRALVAWCDGHVTAESPQRLDSQNIYGGQGTSNAIGWFGPEENNGYWNPRYQLE